MKFIAAGCVIVFLAVPTFAGKPKVVAPCRVRFTVVTKDTLGNLTQGLSKKNVTWFEKKIEKKYPDVCYAAPAPDVRLAFFIAVRPAVYHGTRVVTRTESDDSPVTGSATDEDGNEYDVQGTVETDSVSSTAVPYMVRYGIYTLTVETSDDPGKWKARRRFQQRGLYRLVYGIPVGKGHHPARTVIEEAAKWIHEGGLANQLEGVE